MSELSEEQKSRWSKLLDIGAIISWMVLTSALLLSNKASGLGTNWPGGRS